MMPVTWFSSQIFINCSCKLPRVRASKAQMVHPAKVVWGESPGHDDLTVVSSHLTTELVVLSRAIPPYQCAALQFLYPQADPSSPSSLLGNVFSYCAPRQERIILEHYHPIWPRLGVSVPFQRHYSFCQQAKPCSTEWIYHNRVTNQRDKFSLLI